MCQQPQIKKRFSSESKNESYTHLIFFFYHCSCVMSRSVIQLVFWRPLTRAVQCYTWALDISNVNLLWIFWALAFSFFSSCSCCQLRRTTFSKQSLSFWNSWAHQCIIIVLYSFHCAFTVYCLYIKYLTRSLYSSSAQL